ncbi:hypothetical protein CVIRNUC_004658 [Coccomyxa viridis]|uniref:Uncharacterized protein n=1 Tax=Coccomyxa viridis TaxID=1274662 RepID=A0AAV1I6M4_9CHLO|nr:hypothetical protein CVIRNUC_004658 [Coccomyxa viridis]
MDAGTYMEYGVSIGTLRGFLKGIRRELLEHNFCDLAFTRYLREGHELPMCRLQLEGIPWLYFCRRDPGIGQLCVSLREGCRTTRSWTGCVIAEWPRLREERAEARLEYNRRHWGHEERKSEDGGGAGKSQGGGREEGGEDVDEDADGTACHI